MIETERLRLRRFEDRDVEAYAAIWIKPEVVRFIPGGEVSADEAHDATRQTIERFEANWTEKPGYGPWAVIEKSSDRLIGHLGLRHLPDLNDETELLYLLDSTVWGRGYATEGSVAALQFGFGQLGLRRIIALAVPENTASIRVMEKVGMHRTKGLTEAFGMKLVKYLLEQR